MTKTKTMRKCRIIEYDVFEKSETSIGLVWPAGQAAGQVFDFQSGLQALWVRSGQTAGQARLEKNGLLAALIHICSPRLRIALRNFKRSSRSIY